MVKSLEVFFFKAKTSALEVIFLSFGQIVFDLTHLFAAHHENSFVPAFFKVSIDHLCDNLESGKRNYCFQKNYRKSLEFWIQKSVQTLLLYTMRDIFSVQEIFSLEMSLQDIFFSEIGHTPPPPSKVKWLAPS